MGKKKTFLNKKEAHHFYVLHRSQQDPLYHKDPSEGGSKLILHPANERTSKALEEIEAKQRYNNPYVQNYRQQPSGIKGELREVDELGLPIDGYNYHQHLATISPNGIFITKEGKQLQASGDGELKAGLKLPEEVLASAKTEEFDRMLEAITLKPDNLDPDIRALLELDSEDDKEWDNDVADETKQNKDTFLDDDFMQQLMQAEEAASDDDEEESFDFDKHVARLMAEAEKEDAFNNVSSEESVSSFGDEAIGNREHRDIDKHFDAFLEAEYNDYEIGELEGAECDPRVAGEMEPNAEEVVEILHDHLEKLRIEGSDDKNGSDENMKAEKEKLVMRLEAESDDEPEEAFSPARILSLSGYSEKPKARWDCETIISTYSTLDNHPALIGTDLRSKRAKKKAPSLREEQANRGSLAESESEGQSDGISAVQIPRSKNETPEERRLRKKLIKEQKRDRRAEKKSRSVAYKEEKLRQMNVAQKLRMAACPPEGVSTFKL